MRGFATILGYAVLLVAGLALWFFTRKPGGRIAPLSELIERVLHHRTTRIALIMAWWWLGWHFIDNVVKL
jgi:hypothetical protein